MPNMAAYHLNISGRILSSSNLNEISTSPSFFSVNNHTNLIDSFDENHNLIVSNNKNPLSLEIRNSSSNWKKAMNREDQNPVLPFYNNANPYLPSLNEFSFPNSTTYSELVDANRLLNRFFNRPADGNSLSRSQPKPPSEQIHDEEIFQENTIKFDPLDLWGNRGLAGTDERVHTASSSRNHIGYVTVPSCSHVSYVVGKQGVRIRAIREQTNTYIVTPVNGETSTFVIRGTFENVTQAEGMIINSVKEFDRELYLEARNYVEGDKLRYHLYLPSEYIGLVVGKEGYFVKKVMDSSGVSIITPKIHTLNMFKITGQPHHVYLAIDKMKKHVEETTNLEVNVQAKNDRELELFVSHRSL